MSSKGSFTDLFTGYKLGSERKMARVNAHLLANQMDNRSLRTAVAGPVA